MILLVNLILSSAFSLGTGLVDYCYGTHGDGQYKIEFPSKNEIAFYSGGLRGIHLGDASMISESQRDIYGYDEYVRDAVHLELDSDSIYSLGQVTSMVTSSAGSLSKVYMSGTKEDGSRFSINFRCIDYTE